MNQKIKSASVEIQGDKVLVHLTLEIIPIIGHMEKSKITRREKQVLEGLMLGLSNKEIGTTVNLSERCIKFHVSSLLAKTGARNRVELVRGSMA